MMQEKSLEVCATVMRTPRNVDIEITSRCNLRCRYCYFFDNPQRQYNEVSTDEWLKFFEELGRNGIMNVSIVGGEPFIREDFKELVDGIVKNRMRYSISSNGALITDEIASYIAGTGRCSSVQISIDGSRPEIHDSCRGKGSFAGAIRGIRILQAHHIKVAVRVTIHHYNVDDLEDTAKLLLEDLALPSFSTNSAGYLGSCQSHSSNVILTAEERSKAMQTLLELNIRYNDRITALAGPLAEARLWSRMLVAAQNNEPQHPRRGALTGCGCPHEKIAVRSDGQIIPCNMLSHMAFGKINVVDFGAVWRESLEMAQLRQRHTISLDTLDFCNGCRYKPYCTGNCPGLAFSHLGIVDHPSPDACLRLFLEDGGVLPEIDSNIAVDP